MYYRFCNSGDVKVVGFVPQVDSIGQDYDYDSPVGMIKFLFQKSTTETLIPTGNFHKKAKQTDLVSASFASSQLLVSKQLKEVIEASNYFGVEFLPTELINQSGLSAEYFFINPFMRPMDMLDTDKTEFAYYDGRIKNIQRVVTFDNAAMYDRAYLENRHAAKSIAYPHHQPLLISKIVFKNLPPPLDYDFFPFWGTLRSKAFFVSEKLKREIEQAQFSGIVFTEPNEIYP